MKYRNFLKFLFALNIVAIPLYPKFPLISVPGTFVSVRLEDFLIALTVGCSIFSLGTGHLIRSAYKKTFTRNIVIYLLISLLSVVSAVALTQTIEFHIGMMHLLRRVEYFSLGVLIYFYLKKYPLDRYFFIALTLISISYAFVYGYGQKHFSWPVVITQNQEYSKGVALKWVPGSHINSTFAGHYDLATYLVFLMPLIVSMFYYSRKFRDKLFYSMVFLMGMWLLVNSASRISLASFLGASSLALVFQRKYLKIIPLFLVTLIFIYFSTNLLTRYARVFKVLKDNISLGPVRVVLAQGESIRRDIPPPTPTPMPIFEDRSTSIRLNVEWPRAIRAFRKNPILGTGFSSITLATDNDFLRLLGETGILGAASFLIIIFEIMGAFFEYIRKKFADNIDFILISSILGGIMGALINALFIDVFEASKFAIIFWILVGIGFSLVENSSKSNEIL